MADNTLQFQTKVDLSGLNSGMDAAQSRVSKFGGDVKTAMAAAEAATKQLSDAQIQLGQSAEAGNATAAAIIKEYEQNLDAAQAAVRELSSAETEEAGAVRAGTSARMAANTELRMFEGNMQGSTRAAGAFLSQLPGIGSAMQAAFPIFGAVAVAEILVQVAEKVHNVYNEYVNLYSLQQSVIKTVLADEQTEISLSNQRLSQLREQRVLAAELQGPKQGRANRGQEAGAKFDTNIDTVDLKNAQGLVIATTQRLDDLRKASQQTETYPNGFSSLTDDARRAAAVIPQVTEDLQKYTDTVSTLQQKMQTDEMRSTLMGKEASEKEAPKGRSSFVTQMIEDQQIQVEAAKQSHEQLQNIWMEGYRAEEEAARKATQADSERTELWKKNQAEIRDSAQAAAQAAHDVTAGGIQTQATKVQAGQTLGITDPARDLAALRDLHAQAIAEDQRFINQEIAIYADEPKKVDALQKQLDQVTQKGNQQQLQDTTKILQQQEQKYKTTYQAITQDLNSAISKMITTNESPAKAFAQMLDQMLAQLATFIATFLEKKAEMWVLDQVLTKSSQTATATAQVTSNAAVAASGAMAATAAIPLVGPALAPAAGATMFAQTIAFLGLAAFEQGGIVAGGHGMPVPIMAHAGERVLSAPQTQNFEKMVNGGGNGGGNNVHLSYSPQVNAYDKTGMKSILQSHASDIHDIVRSGLKSGALGRA